MKTYVVVHSRNSSISPSVDTYFIKGDDVLIQGYYGDLTDTSEQLSYIIELYEDIKKIVKLLEIKYDNGCDTLAITILPEKTEDLKIFIS